MNFRFRKTERITSRKEIESLFERGKSSAITAMPLRVVYQESGQEEAGVPVKVLVSVSKKRLRHAIDRNRAKRQIREAYRLQHHSLTEALVTRGKQLRLAFIWLSTQPEPTAMVSRSVERILHSITLKLEKDNT
ncbi:MAG: ribonuclease P protein component [Bacteroidaceae bacterium]|nr:ribonuclease P protein component [Bacteroidaceae bacterium]